MAEFKPVEPTYGMAQGSDPFVVDEAPGLIDLSTAAWRMGWGPKIWHRLSTRPDADPNFNRWAGHEGYEEFAGDLVAAESQEEQNGIKRLIDNSRRDRQIAERGEWGIVPDLIAGVFDPINLVPIPFVGGIGYARAALKGGAAIGGLTAVSEAARGWADPTVTTGEMVMSIGMGTILGGAISGVAGAFGRTRGQIAAREAGKRFDREMANMDMTNPALAVKVSDEGMVLRMGERPIKNADGSRPRIGIAEEFGGYQMKTLDGINYVYEDDIGWLSASTGNRDIKAVVSDDIAEQLDRPERIPETAVRVDEVGLAYDFRNTDWKTDASRYVDEGVDVTTVIRNENEFKSFKVREALWKRRLKQADGQSDEDYQLQIGREAMTELIASKGSGNYAYAQGLERLMQALNFSPMNRGVTAVAGDNVYADSIMRVAGDHAVAVQANSMGARTPPSVLLKAMKWTARWVQWRADFDKQWNRYASGQREANGKVIQGYNVSAAGWAMRNRASRALGNDVLTYEEFAEMTSRAVFEKGEFDVRGHPVNEFAREAAKSYTAMMQEMEVILRDLGIFADQKGTKRALDRAKAWEREAKLRLAKWMWGETGQPTTLQAAIKVGDRTFTGETHDEAIMKMIDELGDEGIDLSETLADENYGYTSRPRTKPDVEGMPDMSDIKTSDEFPYRDELAQFKTTGEAIAALLNELAPQEQTLARKLIDEAGDVVFRVFDYDEVSEAFSNQDIGFLIQNLGAYNSKTDAITLRGRGFNESGLNIEVVLHEATHAATSRRLIRAENDMRKGINSPYAAAAKDYFDLHDELKTIFDEMIISGDMGPLVLPGETAPDFRQIATDMRYIYENPREMMTFGLTNERFRTWLKATPDPRDPSRNMFQRLWDAIFKVLGFDEKDRTQFDRLVSSFEKITKTDRLTGEFDKTATTDFLPSGNVSRETFTTVDDLMAQREAGLSQAQRRWYDEKKKTLDDATARVTELTDELALVNDKTRRFNDAEGETEDYYTRYFDKGEIVTRREAFTRMITKWYERSSPGGARERAEITVDKMINEDVGGVPSLGSARSLNQRALNIPNSWKIEDPEFGTVSMHEFIDTNILATSETYMRRMGVLIEMAREFGDTDLRMERGRVRQHLMEKFVDPAEGDDAKQAGLDQVNEAMGWHDITARTVAGSLRTSDPHRLDNRIANTTLNVTALSTMGKVLLTAVAEVIRPAMVAGMGTAFRVLFMRLLDDLESYRGNVKFGAETGELNDMSMSASNMRMAEMNAGETTTSGGWFEREIAKRMPGYFKLVGLTSWTTFAKEWTMLAAQHAVIVDAQRVAALIRSGKKLSERDELRLNALGINARDALLLADMPTRTGQGGKLVLPDFDQWKGPDHRRARTAMLTAIHAEARRAIVTPSVGDKPGVTSGIWASKGKVKGESDMMRLPMQFLGYGIAAHNKVLTSALQGRDRSVVGGLMMMMMGGIFANYLKTTENAWKAKTYDEILMDGWESAGIGGFWFGDINQMIEQSTMNRVGIRPALGMDPKFGKDMTSPVDVLGSAPAHFLDVSRAFWDPELSGTARAQLLRRAIPYNNVLWWNSIGRTMANEAGSFFEGSSR